MRGILHCLLSGTLSSEYRSALSDYLSPYQFLVGVSGGLEIVIADLQPTLDLHPDWDVFHVDVS